MSKEEILYIIGYMCYNEATSEETILYATYEANVQILT